MSVIQKWSDMDARHMEDLSVLKANLSWVIYYKFCTIAEIPVAHTAPNYDDDPFSKLFFENFQCYIFPPPFPPSAHFASALYSSEAAKVVCQAGAERSS